MASKRKSEALHARKRALERYRMDIGKRDLELLVSKIKKAEGTFLEKVSNRVTNWKVELHGKQVKVGYDKLRKQVITFLPMDERMSNENFIV